MRALRTTPFILFVLISIGTSAFGAETMVQKIKSAALEGASGKGAEFAVKFVGGLIYNTACPAKLPSDQAAEFLCDVLGNVTDKTDEAWKKKVDKQLGEISSQLGQIDKNLTRIQSMIENNHKQTEAQFEQAAV